MNALSSGPIKPARGRFLLVDDSRIVRRVARQILEQAGFDIDEACDGAEALEHVRRHRPDAILLDWNMPVMNGIDCLRALRAEFFCQQPIVIICTTENKPDFIVSAIEAGAQEYIMKPFDGEILLGKLEQLGLLDEAG